MPLGELNLAASPVPSTYPSVLDVPPLPAILNVLPSDICTARTPSILPSVTMTNVSSYTAMPVGCTHFTADPVSASTFPHSPVPDNVETTWVLTTIFRTSLLLRSATNSVEPSELRAIKVG